MDFYEELDQRGLLPILREVEYETPTFVGWEKVRGFLVDLVENKRSVYVYGDYDVDGLMCGQVIRESLKLLGVKDITMYNYRSHTHNVDSVAVQQCIQGHYDYFIVGDSGSSDMGLLESLVRCGIRVVVLDHHNTIYGYDDFCDGIAIINTTIENKFGSNYQMSAGALCFTVFDLLFKTLGKKIPDSMACYAAVSLLSDIMDMSNELNRAIYWLGTKMPEDLIPKPLLYFKGQYSKFNARYISYWFSPRINACFRAEQFVFLNQLYLNDTDSIVKSKCISMIEEVYVQSRDLVKKVSDVLDAYTVKLSNFVFADLDNVRQYYDIEENRLYNYTGYVANDLADKNGKTAIVVCDRGNYYKGSLRDMLGRNYLQVFNKLCYAGGHNSAFGMRIAKLEFNTFIDDLHRVDEFHSIKSIGNAPIIVDWTSNVPDESLLRDMANYNEFTSPGVPVALINKQFIGQIVERHSNYGYKYSWGDFMIQSDYKVSFGRKVLIKPFYSWKLKLQVQ